MSTYRQIVGNEEPITINDLPADRALIEAFLSRGVIDRQVRRDLFGLLYPRKNTEAIVLRSLLGLAATFFLFGLSAILAANWQELGSILRMGLPQLIFVVSVGMASYKGLDQFSGQLMASIAAFSIGGVLIVLSQEFQLNADAPWLFGRWLALTVPIVLVTCYLPLWVAWITLLHIYIGVFLGENFQGDDSLFDLACWSMALASTGFVALQHFVTTRDPGATRWNWLQPRWPRFLLLGWTQVLLVTHFSVRYGQWLFSNLDNSLVGITMLLDMLLLISIHALLRRSQPFDMWSLLVSTLALGTQLLVATIITIARSMGSAGPHESILLLGSLCAFAIFFGCTVYLRKVRDQARAIVVPAEAEEESP